LSGPIARVTFLGTGTSHGVPMIGCRCATCRSSDPRDRRWRASIYVELADGLALLVDTAPDLRAQALSFGVERVDAVLFTHAHADHILGLDDIRRFNDLQGSPVSCYGDAATLQEVRRTFDYAFRDGPEGGSVPRLRLYTLAGPACFGGQAIVPVPVRHGTQHILGYRLGPFAYLTDCSGIPDGSWALLEGVRLLALDALRERPHPTHFSLGEALEVIARLRPERALLTHVCHDLAHGPTSALLPRGVELAYDGLKVDIPGE